MRDAVIDGDAPMTSVDRMAVGFATALRAEGIAVPVGSVATFLQALGVLGVERRSLVHGAGRATLVRRPEELAKYERAFAAFWLQREMVLEPAPEPDSVMLGVEDDDDDLLDPAQDEGPGGDEQLVVRYSATEVLRHKDFAAYSPAEHAEARRLMAGLRFGGAQRRSRRRRPARSGRLDLRGTVRGALRHEGEPIQRAFTRPVSRPRPVVLLCDVSGSMEPYSRALLRFMQAAVVGRGRVEAFALGTRLTRLTRELSSHDPDVALASAARSVQDWSGGTRLGQAVQAFNTEWGVRGMARGAVVVVLSDGWDRGDPAELADAMARLRRVAFRIVWVNPLKASPGYAPLARGMAAALPHVDVFIEGHSLSALEHLAEVVARP